MTTTKLPRLMVINEPDGRRFSKALALEIGRDHAEVLLQIEFLISISKTPMMKDRIWTRQSVASLQEEHFPYWGRTFISDILNDLCNGYQHICYSISGEGRSRKRVSTKVFVPALLDKDWFNESGWDSTAWYTLNLDGIAALKSVTINEQAFTVTAERKRVTTSQTTRFRNTANPLPQYSKPVTGSAGDFISETPTETPTERGAASNTIPPEPEAPPFNPAIAFPLEKTTELVSILPKVATRNFPSNKRAEMVSAFLEEK